MPPESPTTPTTESERGVLFGLGAYLLWGVLPLWWKQLAHLPAAEVLAHRVLWSALFAAILLGLLGRLGEVRRALAARGTRRALLASTLLISGNWFLFIWAVANDHVTEASLGYYLNPLLNVLLGRVFLGERLGRLARVAVGLAAAGVLILAVGLGRLPLVSIGLAVSFAVYGLVRKTAPVAPLPGLAVEVGGVAPLALGWLLVLGARGQGAFPGGPHDALFLVGAGPATALPLLLFAAAARRLRYSTLGIVHYVAPTCQLLLAVLVFGEPFTRTHAVTFALIWTAVGLYGFERVQEARAAARAAVAAS